MNSQLTINLFQDDQGMREERIAEKKASII